MSYTLDKRMFSVLSTSLEYAENNTTQTSSAVRSFASLYRIEIDQNLGEISRGFGGKEWSKNKIVHKTSGFRFGCGMTATSSSKGSRNQSELLAGILLTWSQAYPSGHLFQELKKS